MHPPRSTSSSIPTTRCASARPCYTLRIGITFETPPQKDNQLLLAGAAIWSNHEDRRYLARTTVSTKRKDKWFHTSLQLRIAELLLVVVRMRKLLHKIM
jgi:hypothetical protein